MRSIARKRIVVKGIVQGVGFRPFVYRLAQQHDIKGRVLNSSRGVAIDAEGPPVRLARFIRDLRREKPVNARIDLLTVSRLAPAGYRHFTIRESVGGPGRTLISPDLALCTDCRREIFDPVDRRHRYPFTNCTNCGPRHSIIDRAPYDRSRTTMRVFRMCPDCAAEYRDPLNRRFHAQPNACPVCGPELRLYHIDGKALDARPPIETAVRLLRQGRILAIKGIGGFHIACDATNQIVVQRLRTRKCRPHKPFAVMAKLEDIRRVAYVSGPETETLLSPAAPIVLLRKRPRTLLARAVAPGNPYLGLMLPYAPLHHLLFQDLPYLVMTSGNLQDEPVVSDDAACFDRLAGIVDYVLTNNRSIKNRNDDSIVTHAPITQCSILRRSRGYAPDPIDLPIRVRPTLGCGGELKGTFCLARDKQAFLSPHIGDMENAAAMASYQEALRIYQKWFGIKPEVVACDLHPDYMTTRFARSLEIEHKVAVQHHLAHIASCAAENQITGEVIGLAFDGTGYGLDGRIWGSEFIVGSLKGLRRAGHLGYLPLPGGESSIRHPYRIAVAYLLQILGDLPDLPFLKTVGRRERAAIEKMLGQNFNVVYTSSLGRLFDAVSAMLNVVTEITFEAQAAMQLEYLATARTRTCYPTRVADQNDALVIDPEPIIRGVVNDLTRGAAIPVIATKFHNSIIAFSLDACQKLRRRYNIDRVALSGGSFQNRRLLGGLARALKTSGFVPVFHQKVPYNDGGISLGQVIIANHHVSGHRR